MASLRPAALSFQGARSAWKGLVCAECRRSLSSSAAVASGHNRWSKIKHEKGAADAKKTALRSSIAKTLTYLSSMYGPDLSTNPQLATTVAHAKKNAVPKAMIESAIARGQGKSATGAKLESVTFEIMMPPSVAFLVEGETESKARAQQDLNAIIRRKGGMLKSTSWFFERCGRVVFGEKETDLSQIDESDRPEAPTDIKAVTADDIMFDVLEAGAEDMETDEEGNIVVWTKPLRTKAVVDAITGSVGGQPGKFADRLEVLSDDTIYKASDETRAPLGADAKDLRNLTELIAALRAYPDVRAIYCNADQGNLDGAAWEEIEESIDW